MTERKKSGKCGLILVVVLGIFVAISIVSRTAREGQAEDSLQKAEAALSAGHWDEAKQLAEGAAKISPTASQRAIAIVTRSTAELDLARATTCISEQRWADAHAILNPGTVAELRPHHPEIEQQRERVTNEYAALLLAQAGTARDTGDLDGLLAALVSVQRVRADGAVAAEIDHVRVRLAQRAADAGQWDRALEQLAGLPDDMTDATGLRQRAQRELIEPLLDRAREAVQAGAAAEAVAAVASLTDVARRHPSVARAHESAIQELAGASAELKRRADDERASRTVRAVLGGATLTFSGSERGSTVQRTVRIRFNAAAQPVDCAEESSGLGSRREIKRHSIAFVEPSTISIEIKAEFADIGSVPLNVYETVLRGYVTLGDRSFTGEAEFNTYRIDESRIVEGKARQRTGNRSMTVTGSVSR